MKIRAVVVDDEELARERLIGLLEPYGDLEVVGEADHGEKAITVISELKPDVVFLDIQMPGCSGVEVAASLPSGRPRVVFCTAYDRYAIDAFEVDAVDYLLKPVNRSRLAKTLEKLRAEIPEEVPLDRNLRRQGPARILARRGQRYRVVRIDDVLCFCSEEGLTRARTEEGVFWMDPSLSDLEERLDPESFFRVSRQSIVNLESVEEVIPLVGGHGQVKLENGEKFDVSRRRMKELLERLKGEGS